MPVRSSSLLLTTMCAGSILLCFDACGKDDNHSTNVPRRDAGLDAQMPDDAQVMDGAAAQGGSGGAGNGGAGGADEDAGPCEPFDPSKD